MGEESLAKRATRDIEEVVAGVPRWPAALAILLVSALYLLISDTFTLGPDWLLPAVTLALLAAFWVARLRGNAQLARTLALAVAVVLTVTVVASAVLLVVRLAFGQALGRVLLRDAALIWVANIV